MSLHDAIAEAMRYRYGDAYARRWLNQQAAGTAKAPSSAEATIQTHAGSLGRRRSRVLAITSIRSRRVLAPVLATLAEKFTPTRKALNDLSERLLIWRDIDLP
jgi:hypothetical protein